MRLRLLLLPLAAVVTGCPQLQSDGESSSSTGGTFAGTLGGSSDGSTGGTTTGGSTASSSSATSSTGTASGATSSSPASGSSGSSSPATSSTGSTSTSTAATSSTGGTSGTAATSSSGSGSSSGSTGRVWSQLGAPGATGALLTLSMTSATDGWAGDDHGRLIHWNGSRWNAVAAGDSMANNAQIESVWAKGNGEVWFVAGEALRTCSSNCDDANNDNFSAVTTLPRTPVCHLKAVCGHANHGVYAVGETTAGASGSDGCMVERANGSGTWNAIPLGLADAVEGCWVTPSGDVFVASHRQVHHYSPSTGTVSETVTLQQSARLPWVYFTAIWGNGTELFATTQNRRVFRRDPQSQSWSMVFGDPQLPASVDDDGFSAIAGTATEAYAVGGNSTGIQAAYWNGTTWSQVTRPLADRTRIEAIGVAPGGPWFLGGAEQNGFTVRLWRGSP